MLSLRNYSRDHPPVPKAMMVCAMGLFAVVTHLAFLNLLLPVRWRVNQSTDYFEVYEPTARNVLAGKGLVGANGKPMVEYPPGFALIVAGSYAAAEALGISANAGIRVEIAASVAATGMLVYALGAQVSGWVTGLVASLLWSTYPLHLWLSKQPDSGQPYTVLFLLSIYLLGLSCQEGKGAFLAIFGTGLLVGFASLVRPIGIGTGVVFLLFLWLLAPRNKRKTTLGLSAVLALGNLLAVLPWEVSARQATGRWIPLSANGPASMLDGLTLSAVRKPLDLPVPVDVRDLIQTFVAEGTTLHSTSDLGKLVVHEAIKHPVAAAKLFAMKAARCWYANDSRQFETEIALVQAPYLLLGLWGMLCARRRTRGPVRPFAMLTLLCVLYFWVMATIVLSIVRYLLPVMALLMICGAYGLGRLALSLRLGPADND